MASASSSAGTTTCASPSTLSISGSARSKSLRAPRQPHPGVVSGIGIRIVRIGRRRRSVNDLWVVRRNVNYVGLRWLNDDHLLASLEWFLLHGLLRAGL